MKFCRYDKEVDPDSCEGCREGCLSKQPPAYINRDFEDAVKEMISSNGCSDVLENKESQRASL